MLSNTVPLNKKILKHRSKANKYKLRKRYKINKGINSEMLVIYL